MPAPAVLVLEPVAGGNAMLFRFTSTGDDCGDTWHQSIDEAKEQAAFEYENAVGMWVSAPSDRDLALQHALQLRRGVTSA
jgi:hypothetical protein